MLSEAVWKLQRERGTWAGREESVSSSGVCFGVLSHQTEGSKWA